MDIKQVKQALTFLQLTLENITKAAVKTITAATYTVRLDDPRVRVENFPRPTKNQQVTVTNQKQLEQAVREATTQLVKASHDIERQLAALKPSGKVQVTNLGDIPKAPTAVRVTNQPTEIAVNNLQTVLGALRDLTEAVKKLPTTYPEVKIPAFPEIPPFPKLPEYPKEIAVSNLEELKSENPEQYVPVRLTDGKKFYKAIQEIVTQSGGRYAFIRSDGNKAQARIDSTNRIEMGGTFRFNVNDIDNSDPSITYIGFETTDKEWMVQRIDKTSGQQFRYATEKNNPDIPGYGDAFSQRGSLTYGIISEAL